VCRRPLCCCDCWLESRWGHGSLSFVNVVCCQLEVSALGWSLAQRSPTECAVSKYHREASSMKLPKTVKLKYLLKNAFVLTRYLRVNMIIKQTTVNILPCALGIIFMNLEPLTMKATRSLETSGNSQRRSVLSRKMRICGQSVIDGEHVTKYRTQTRMSEL
jgi:hypothetical protein